MSNNYQWKKIKKSGAFSRKWKKKYMEMTTGVSTLSMQNKSSETREKLISSIFENNGRVKLLNRSSKKCNSSQEEVMDVSESKSDPDEIESVIETDSDNSEDDHDMDISRKEQILQKLRKWSTDHNIRQTALKDILKIINFVEPGSVPCDPRTLLETPKVVMIKNIGERGKYWHQGLFKCLKYTIGKKKPPKSISLNINIDGLPIAKSAKQEFWPILCNIHELPYCPPMIVGIYCGIGKPILNEYLHQFVEELKVGINDGFLLNGNLCYLTVRAFICDSPARAFIKGTANYNSQNGCLKCTTVGEYSYASHTNIFPRTGCPKRTNEDFRAKICELHHKCTSPLEELSIDMIEDFPVSDSLHLLDLGIMKRCLLGWRDGTFNKRSKWSAKDIQKVSIYLTKCKLPKEIHRRVRPLDCLSHWKGTEYRSFLYYIGIVVLKKNLPPDVYAHFLLLFCAITICSSIHYFQYLHVARKLLESYVERYRDIYGVEFITSNVHNLCHVVDEVHRFGALSTFNAYPFENMLYQLKLLLRQGNKPLVQVAKRIQEINNCAEGEIELDRAKQIILLKNPINNEGCYSKIYIPDSFLLSADFANSWILTNKIQLIQFKCAFKGLDGFFFFKGQKVKSISCFFEKPFQSSFLNIFECCVYDLEPEETYSIADIKCKMVALTYDDTTTVFVPLIHTIK